MRLLAARARLQNVTVVRCGKRNRCKSSSKASRPTRKRQLSERKIALIVALLLSSGGEQGSRRRANCPGRIAPGVLVQTLYSLASAANPTTPSPILEQEARKR